MGTTDGFGGRFLATQPKAYDPSKDIDFIVPTRLQEVDIIDAIRAGVWDDLVARKPTIHQLGRLHILRHDLYLDEPASLRPRLDVNYTLRNTILPQPDRSYMPLNGQVDLHGRLTGANEISIHLDEHTSKVGGQILENEQDIETATRNHTPLQSTNLEVATEEIDLGSKIQTMASDVNTPDSTVLDQYRTSSLSLAQTNTDLATSENSSRLDFATEEKPPRLSDEFQHERELYSPLSETAESVASGNLAVDLDIEESITNVHILGMGTVGKFMAHTLAGPADAPRITLLMHRPLMMQQWHEEGAAITIMKAGGRANTRSGFGVESSAKIERQDPEQRFAGFGKCLQHSVEPPTTPIEALIVTTETSVTVSALMSVKSRLRPTSIIYFVQEGMGIMEKVNDTVFPDPETRPVYVLGNITHGLASTAKKFTIIEEQSGSMACSKIPRLEVTRSVFGGQLIPRNDFSWTPRAAIFLGILSRAPEFNTQTFGHKWFYRDQLTHVAINSVIGPLSVMFDCTNEQLLFNYSATLVMRSVIGEISTILRSLPELIKVRNLRKEWSPEKLEAMIVSTLRKTGRNTSSMLQHVRAGERSNVEFFNGYLVKRAKELKIRSPINEMLINVVKAKQLMRNREKASYVPYERSND